MTKRNPYVIDKQLAEVALGYLSKEDRERYAYECEMELKRMKINWKKVMRLLISRDLSLMNLIIMELYHNNLCTFNSSYFSIRYDFNEIGE